MAKRQAADRAEVAAAMKRQAERSQRLKDDHETIEAHVKQVEAELDEVKREAEAKYGQLQAQFDGAKKAWDVERGKLTEQRDLLDNRLRKIGVILT